MKLYNIFEDIIFEESTLLLEGVGLQQILDAIEGEYAQNGRKFIRRYDITYAGDGINAQGRRQIEVYAYGTLKGNPVIRVFQIYGDSKRREMPGWKILRVDRIKSWKPTNYRGWEPTPWGTNYPQYVSDEKNGQDKSMDGGRALNWVQEFPSSKINNNKNKI